MITVADVRTWLRLPAEPAEGDEDTPLLVDVTAATNQWVGDSAYVRELDPATWPVDGPWPDDVTQGAVMLAARLYRRRNTPGGIEALSDGAVYVPRRDSDVDRLLHMGAWAPPRVG